MSFLAPLYLAGLAALALPIAFHLIRRRPSGTMPFSTVMFLTPSPPQLAKRSRIEHWFLLALRALALAALATAFARPFFREASAIPAANVPVRRVALLVDSSASMRRGDLWEQAMAHVRETMESLGANDEAALIAFDSTLRVVVDWPSETAARIGAERIQENRDQIRRKTTDLRPTWEKTDMGSALAATAEALNRSPNSSETTPCAELEIVLISDLQTGARLDALQNYPWPVGVALRVVSLEFPQTSNGAVRLLQPRADEAEPTSAERRVRLFNAADSQNRQFQVAWRVARSNDAGPLAERPAAAHYDVPPGESRVFAISASPPVDAVGIQLTGDDFDFDNLYYVAPNDERSVRILYYGPDDYGPDDYRPNELDAGKARRDDAGNDAHDATGTDQFYFLQRAFPTSSSRQVDVSRSMGDAGEIADEALAMAVVAAPLADDALTALTKALLRGVNVVCVAMSPEMDATLMTLADDPGVRITVAPENDFRLWSHIDRQDQLLAPFADPRFGDFSRIHFWRSRRVETASAAWKRLARFDDGSNALLTMQRGEGHLFVLASGWQPSESQLALSTKFVPLLGQMLSAGRQAAQSQYEVGDRIALASFPRPIRRLVGPDDHARLLSPDQTAFVPQEPGIYQFHAEHGEWRVAVNLAASESDTAPLPASALAGFGVPMHDKQIQAAEMAISLGDAELERRQALWQWLVAGTMGLALLETVCAGQRAKSERAPGEQPIESPN